MYSILRIYESCILSAILICQHCIEIILQVYVQGVPKKMGFSGKIAITTLKHIQNANVGGVLENSGYLLHYGH